VKPVRVGVWGAGAWGEKHARVYHDLEEASFVGTLDHHPGRGAEVAARYGGRTFEDPQAFLRECEAVSVAVPTVAHREAAEQSLGAGCHVLVEKPMAPTVADALAMERAADRAGVQLQVGHVERFNPALLAARAHVRSPKFIEAHRLALFQPRSLDIDVVFDLMIHDIDLVLDSVGSPLEHLSAVGVAVLSQNEDIANARLEFADGCVANLTASRVSQDRLRRIRYFQPDSYLSIDLFKKSCEYLRVKAPAGAVGGMAALGSAFSREALEVADGEPLALELRAFLRSLRGDGPGAATAAAGREALRVAEQVRDAMKRRAKQWRASESAVS
jgi:predicted dehydrogenase